MKSTIMLQREPQEGRYIVKRLRAGGRGRCFGRTFRLQIQDRTRRQQVPSKKLWLSRNKEKETRSVTQRYELCITPSPVSVVPFQGPLSDYTRISNIAGSTFFLISCQHCHVLDEILALEFPRYEIQRIPSILRRIIWYCLHLQVTLLAGFQEGLRFLEARRA